MEDFIITPKTQVAARIQENNGVDAIANFATTMNMDMNAYFKAVTPDQLHEDRLEQIGGIIDVFEDWLESKGITNDMIKNDERDDDESAALIYGTDYDELEDSLHEVLGYNEEDENRE